MPLTPESFNVAAKKKAERTLYLGVLSDAAQRAARDEIVEFAQALMQQARTSRMPMADRMKWCARCKRSWPSWSWQPRKGAHLRT